MITKNYIEMDYNHAIESLCFKFGHAVTEYDVFRWLRNFDESEWNMALNVLNKVVYYSSDRIDETLEYQIKNIVAIYNGKCIYILPSSNVGKSGHVMAYHAKKIIEKLRLQESPLSLLNIKDLATIKTNTVIVLLDDFSGTGKSIKKFYEKNVKPIVVEKGISVCALTVAFLEKAKIHLKAECGLDIYGDIYEPAFVRRGSVFGYEKNMIQVRDFCFKKGEMLFPDWKYTDQKPLGYQNSQALVCFEHTTPNNTLPILWYDDLIPETQRKWHAIFPRFVNSRMERGRRMRRNSNFWLSAMSRLNLPNIEWSRHHTIDSLRLMSYVAQKYHGRSDLYIAQILGISMVDIEEIVNIGKKKCLIDDTGDLTQEAKIIYKEIRKKDRILEHNISRKLSMQNISKVYVPISFRGFS